MIKLKIGWEEALQARIKAEILSMRRRRPNLVDKISFTDTKKKIKELNKLIISGRAVVGD